jgi:hypothetical protein
MNFGPVKNLMNGGNGRIRDEFSSNRANVLFKWRMEFDLCRWNPKVTV